MSNALSGIRIFAGQWRPHYPFEQIAWVSPPWPCQDYIWLDFPEALFCSAGLLYLSHVNPQFPVLYPDVPKVDWQEAPDGLTFERTLPNGVRFGGRLGRGGDSAVEMELHIGNGSSEPLTDIKLQTCAYLRAVREFADFTGENKFIHVPAAGWVPLSEAEDLKAETGAYRVGWRSGPAVADLPLIVTLSNRGDRLVAMTWHEDTYSLIGNPDHPCMHADPCFKDLEPGESASISGRIVFFEGSLAEFEEHWRSDGPVG